MSASAKVGSMSETLTQLVTTRSGGRLDSMQHALQMGDQDNVVLQQTFTGLCNVVRTLDQKMDNLSHNGTDQLIKGSSNSAPRDDFEARLSTLTEYLDWVRQLTVGWGFNTVVVDFKSLADVSVWVQVNLPSDAPTIRLLYWFGHSIGKNSRDRSEKRIGPR